MDSPTIAKRNERNTQTARIFWTIAFIVTVAFVGITAFAMGYIVGTSPHLAVQEAAATAADTCQINTLSPREVYNEPANLNTRVGTLEAGVYRVIAFGGEDWVSVDWNSSGYEATSATIQQLDWLQVQLGVDQFLGDCRDIPLLGIRVRDDDQ